MVAQHNPKDDHGTQYRSAVFTHTEEQQAAAEAWKLALEAARGGPIVTSIEPAGTFFPAEECMWKRGGGGFASAALSRFSFVFPTRHLAPPLACVQTTSDTSRKEGRAPRRRVRNRSSAMDEARVEGCS